MSCMAMSSLARWESSCALAAVDVGSCLDSDLRHAMQ
jgi:hypothetical protein